MWRDDALLLDMLLAAREVRTFVADVDSKKFFSDRLIQSACQYQLQVIGEAASKVSGEFQALHPEIAWPEIIAFRNRLVHDYQRIDPAKVWEIIKHHVDPLIRILEPLVPPEPKQGDR